MRRLLLAWSCLIITTMLLAAGPAAAAERPAREQARIEALLQTIAYSDAIFIRNGENHMPLEAIEHLRMKLDYVGDRVKTAEQFIEYIASKSSFSGKTYFVQLPGREKMKAGIWLSANLKKIDEVMTQRAKQATESNDKLYVTGWDNGCNSAYHAYGNVIEKSVYATTISDVSKGNATYKEAWNTGFKYCRSLVESTEEQTTQQ